MSDGGFTFSESLDAEVADAAARVRAARYRLALTGAGLSVESGIPPFRGPGGLWTRYGEPPMDGYQRFLRDPARAWRERLNPTESWARGLRDTLAAARPNAGHLALAELERRGLLECVITQNIDDLHRQAGSRALLEIHGNHLWLRCVECHRRFDPEAVAVDPEQLPPLCPACGGWIKGDTVQFGEPIPPDVLRACYEAVAQTDLILLIGTSGTVYPAADFPIEVLRGGGTLLEVNPYESELSELATLSLRGPAGAVMERLLHHLAAAAEPGRAA